MHAKAKGIFIDTYIYMKDKNEMTEPERERTKKSLHPKNI